MTNIIKKMMRTIRKSFSSSKKRLTKKINRNKQKGGALYSFDLNDKQSLEELIDRKFNEKIKELKLLLDNQKASNENNQLKLEVVETKEELSQNKPIEINASRAYSNKFTALNGFWYRDTNDLEALAAPI